MPGTTSRGPLRAYAPHVAPDPVDPFAGDPDDPARALDALEDVERDPPLDPVEREDVLEDLQDLEVYEALLAPRGVRGLRVDCDECGEPHYVSFDLLRSGLRQLLDEGTSRRHEPAFSPDPAAYVTWDYARGFTDAVLAQDADGDA